jgi:microcystin degradation protein MlrC
VGGRIARITDGKITSSGHLPVEFDMGTTVVLEAGRIAIVLTESPGPGHDPNVYRRVGLEPAAAHIVVVKTPVTFWSTYAGIMKRAILAEGPGLSTSQLQLLPFVKAPRPLYPLDPLCSWQA